MAVNSDTKVTPVSRVSLALGTHGQVRMVRRGNGWQADTSFRDWDGVIRRVRSSGSTKSAAAQSLQLVLRDRRFAGRDIVTRETKFPIVAEKWFSELVDHSPSTMQRYRERLDRFIVPAFREVRMREITVGLIDRHLHAVQEKHGAASAKITKTILSGIFGL